MSEKELQWMFREFEGKSLDLSRRELTELPPEIGNLTNLTELNLSSNQLATLPPEIWQLTKLIVLDLQNTKLATLPPEIGNLTNLTELKLSCNPLVTLPPEIGQLTKLTRLTSTPVCKRHEGAPARWPRGRDSAGLRRGRPRADRWRNCRGSACRHHAH